MSFLFFSVLPQIVSRGRHNVDLVHGLARAVRVSQSLGIPWKAGYARHSSTVNITTADTGSMERDENGGTSLVLKEKERGSCPPCPR